jgi:hypothetical protein
MKKTIVPAEEGVAAPYSSATLFHSLAFVSGQGPRNGHTRKLAKTFQDQMVQTMENLKWILQRNGSSMENFGDPIENPRGFRVEPLEDLIQPARPISYGILMPGPHIPTGVPYIRVTDIQDGQVVTALVRRTAREIDQAYKRSRLKAGDLLLSIRGHVGRMAIVPPPLDGANITQDTARLATVDTLESHYLKGCLAAPGMQHRMVGLTCGAAVQGINLGDVKELPIPVPPLPLQQQFTALVERVERLSAVQREALRQAEHCFQTLLRGAFPETDSTNGQGRSSCMTLEVT